MDRKEHARRDDGETEVEDEDEVTAEAEEAEGVGTAAEKEAIPSSKDSRASGHRYAHTQAS